MDLSNKNLQLKRVTKIHQKGYKHTPEKRIEVVTKTLALGNMRLVSELTGVAYELIRAWKAQPWWADMEAEIRASRKAETNNKLDKLVNLALESVADRLENGDFRVNNKTGEVDRIPVAMKEANKVANDLLVRQRELDKDIKADTTNQVQLTMAEQLATLAQEFAKFNTKRLNTGEVVDAIYEEREEGLQEGSSPIHLEAGSGEEEDGTERSTESNG